MNYNKLLSGQWILTVLSGCVFAYTACLKIIPPDATIAILTTVFISYFKRDRQPPEAEEPNAGGK
jgi:hypothetical protein